MILVSIKVSMCFSAITTLAPCTSLKMAMLIYFHKGETIVFVLDISITGNPSTTQFDFGDNVAFKKSIGPYNRKDV